MSHMGRYRREEAIQFIMKNPTYLERYKETLQKMDNDDLNSVCYDIRNSSDEKTLEIEFLDRIKKMSRKEAIVFVEECGQGGYLTDLLDEATDDELKECVYGIRNRVFEEKEDDMEDEDLIYVRKFLNKDSYPNAKLLNIKSTLNRDQAIEFLKENKQYYKWYEEYDDDALYYRVYYESKYLTRETTSSIKLCRVCSKKSTKCCGKCGVAYYCSADCQKSHWKEHKKVCGVAEK